MHTILIFTIDIKYINPFKLHKVKTNLVHELAEDSTDLPKHVLVKDYTFEFVICALPRFHT